MVAAGAIALISSPTVRKKLRQLAVKGTSAIMGLSEKMTQPNQKMIHNQENYQFDFSTWEPELKKKENNAHPEEFHSLETDQSPKQEQTKQDRSNLSKEDSDKSGGTT